MPLQLSDVEKAAAVLEGKVVRTPLVRAPSLDDLAGAKVWLKLENMQLTGAFKARGALVRMMTLDTVAKQRGVLAVSAGNHAQGVAYHAKELGIPATIVMPESTPFTKIRRTEALGAEVVVYGEAFDEAYLEGLRLCDERGLTFIHPFDDPEIICGQGTVALEVLADCPDIDAMIVPIGGGGLMAGCALVAKSMKPTLDLVGVQAELYASMQAAIRGETISFSGAQTLAEGIAVKKPGKLTQEMIKRYVDEIVSVNEIQIEQAVQTLIDRQSLVAEGAGAAPLAALSVYKDRFAGKNVCLVISGGNIDGRIVSSVLMRGLVREGRLVRLRIETSDRPGSLAQITTIISKEKGNILEIFHQRLFYDVPVKSAEVDIVVETLDADHVKTLVQLLRDRGFNCRLLSSRTDGNLG